MNSNTLSASAIFFTTLYLLSVSRSVIPGFNVVYYISFAEDTQLYFSFTESNLFPLPPDVTEIKKMFRFSQGGIPLLFQSICVMVSAVK